MIGNFRTTGNKLKQVNEIISPEDSRFYRMTLIENNKKLLITDWKRNCLHLTDLDGGLIKSFNPNNIFKDPAGVCILIDSNREDIFIGDDEHHKIFVFNSNFELKFCFGDSNLKYPSHLKIDNEFNKSLLYVSDSYNDKVTIWNSKNGTYVDKIDIETPKQVNFTENSLFISSPVLNSEIKDNKVVKINDGGNCIFEIDKKSLEIKRRISGNWFSPNVLYCESSDNLFISAYTFDFNSKIKSEMMHFFKIDQNGRIINKVELLSLQKIDDAILVNNKIIASIDNKLKFYELQ